MTESYNGRNSVRDNLKERF